MSIQKYEGKVREDKLNWNDKAAELIGFDILKRPGRSLLGIGQADVRFDYKNNKKTLLIYGPENAVFARAMEIIARKKNFAGLNKMQKSFLEAWTQASFHKVSSSNVKSTKDISEVNEFIKDQFYAGRKRNPFNANTLLEDKIKESGFEDVNSFAEQLDKNKSSLYHHTSGKRGISKEVAMEYARKLKCDPVDLMFNKLSIPVWGKVNLLKAEELDEVYDQGRIYAYYAKDADMEQVIVPRDLYQHDIKAVKISARGSMYDNQIVFYYRATERDESCLNKLCVVGIKGDVDNPFDSDDQWFFGLYENMRGKANLINPDPFISMENKYIKKDFRPDIMARVIAIINPEAINDKTKMRSQIDSAVLIREEERLLAQKAAIHLAQKAGEQSRKMNEHIKELNKKIGNIQEQMQNEMSSKHSAMNLFEKDREIMNKIKTSLKVIK